MGLLDKIRNVFAEEVEEEEEEITVEEIKKDVRSVPIDSPAVEKVTPTKIEPRRAPKEENTKSLEDDLLGLGDTAKTPVFFTDKDFEELMPTPKREERRSVVETPKRERVVVEEPKREEPKPYGGNYTSTTIIQKEKQVFKPTPIISPVYGVLDKNYHKEDIVDRTDRNVGLMMDDSVDGLSVDAIRNKAYGTLEDDLVDTMAKKKKKEKEVEVEEDDLFDELEEPAVDEEVKDIRELENVTMDLTKELDNLLTNKESKKEKKKNTKKEELSENELFNLIDSMYEEGKEE